MNCPKCGASVEDDAKVCGACGEPLENSGAESQADTGAEGNSEAEKEKAAESETGEQNSESQPQNGAGETPVVQPVIAEPEKAEPGKKGNKKFVVGGLLAAAVVAVGTFAATKMNAKDPKTVVLDAFESVYSESVVYPSDEIFDFGTMIERMYRENSQGEFSLTFDDSSIPDLAPLSSASLYMNNKSDLEQKKTFSEMKVQYGGMDMMSAGIYMDNTQIMLGIPEFTSKIFSLNYGEDLEGQIERSPYLGQYVTESGVNLGAFSDYMDYIWSLYGNEENRPFDLNALWNRYKEGSKAIDDFKAAMTVETADKKEYTVNGETVQCQGYDVAITKDSVIQFLKTTSKFFMEDETLKKDMMEYFTQVLSLYEGMQMSLYQGSPEELQQELWGMAQMSVDEMIAELDKVLGDVTMKVYVDKKGHLAAVDASSDLTIENEEGTIAISLVLEGGNYPTQNGTAKITLTDKATNESISMDIRKQGTYDGNTLTCDWKADLSVPDMAPSSLSYTGTYGKDDGSYHVELTGIFEGEKGSLGMTGRIEDLEKGAAINVIADEILLKAGESDYIKLSGNWAISPMEGEVAVPEGEQMDILAATEDDWAAVLEEMWAGVMKLLYTFYS